MFISQIVTRATVFVKHSYIGCALEIQNHFILIYITSCRASSEFVPSPDLSCIKLNAKTFCSCWSRYRLQPPPSKKASRFPTCLGCIRKRKKRQLERIFCQFKEENRRFSGAKSRFSDAEMAEKTPRWSLREFFRYTLSHSASPRIDSSLRFRKAESFPHRISKRIIRKILFQKAAFLQQLEQRISRAIIFRSVHGKV